MTGTMKAAVLVRPGRFELRDVERPRPGRDEVLIQISEVGICGTDIHMFKGHYAADRLPLIAGHEFTGKVAQTGENVRGLKIGTPVVVDTNIGCTLCDWCRRNEILNCPHMQQMGITIDGAFAEYISVPARLVIAAPEYAPTDILFLTEPLSCVVRCARKAQITFGQSVLVLGAGPIGNLHVQLLRTIGAAPVIVADLAPDRVAMAVAAGADVGVSAPEELEETVMRHTGGRGADVVIESVGNPALYRQAGRLVRKGGHIAAFGLTGAGETLPVDILQMILQENSIKGSVAGMGQDMHDALTLLAHGRIKTEPFTRAAWPLEEIQSVFETIGDRPGDLKTRITLTHS